MDPVPLFLRTYLGVFRSCFKAPLKQLVISGDKQAIRICKTIMTA